MSETKYGEYYWCVKVPNTVAKSGEIYLYADDVEFCEGAVTFYRFYHKKIDQPDQPNQVNLMLPAGAWYAVYAASVVDGSPVAVEHWAEEGLN